MLKCKKSVSPPVTPLATASTPSETTPTVPTTLLETPLATAFVIVPTPFKAPEHDFWDLKWQDGQLEIPFPMREIVGRTSIALPKSSMMLPNESVYWRILSDRLSSSCRLFVCLSENGLITDQIVWDPQPTLCCSCVLIIAPCWKWDSVETSQNSSKNLQTHSSIPSIGHSSIHNFRAYYIILYYIIFHQSDILQTHSSIPSMGRSSSHHFVFSPCQNPLPSSQRWSPVNDDMFRIYIVEYWHLSLNVKNVNC